jgi:hypothetical protein
MQGPNKNPKSLMKYEKWFWVLAGCGKAHRQVIASVANLAFKDFNNLSDCCVVPRFAGLLAMTTKDFFRILLECHFEFWVLMSVF